VLDAAIGPDFGEVGADPAVVNLGAFEVVQQEGRDFFIKGAQLFEFALSGSEDRIFHSRRIGRAPQGAPPSGATFSRMPDAAMILGAAKLSGRTAAGLSLGVIAAVTDRETGQAWFESDEREEVFVAEPMTFHGVLRARQDLREGDSQVGGIVTMLSRRLPDDGTMDALPTSALSGGFDFQHQWAERMWALSGYVAGGYVRGDSTALLTIQQSSNHYRQRPGATRVSVDSTATSLSGLEWRLEVERQGGDHWTGGVWVGEVTPGFEINDLGVTKAYERLDAGLRVGYRETVPSDHLLSYDVKAEVTNNWLHEALDDVWSTASWDRVRVSANNKLSGSLEFRNFWKLSGDVRFQPNRMSRSSTRGGPLIQNPASGGGGLRIVTDPRLTASFGLGVDASWAQQGAGDSFTTDATIMLRPGPRVLVELGPEFSISGDGKQHVGQTSVVPFAPTSGIRYLFGDIDRRSLGMSTQVDVIFSPFLSLEVFAQPMITAVDYVEYKQLELPESFQFDVFDRGSYLESGGEPGCAGGRICSSGSDQFIDFDGDGLADHSFPDADFNERSLLANVVLRWEFRPGSRIFVVWQHQQIERVNEGDFDVGRDLGALLRSPSTDTFIVKVDYLFGR
jgi:hypothetical protein